MSTVIRCSLASLRRYWLQHPERVALDYTGELCLTTSDLDPRRFLGRFVCCGWFQGHLTSPNLLFGVSADVICIEHH